MPVPRKFSRSSSTVSPAAALVSSAGLTVRNDVDNEEGVTESESDEENDEEDRSD